MWAPPQTINMILWLQAGVQVQTEELDNLTRQLLDGSQDMEVESADLLKGEDPNPGAMKADPVALGGLVGSVLPSVVPNPAVTQSIPAE